MERERREAEKSRGIVEKPKGANHHSRRRTQGAFRDFANRIKFCGCTWTTPPRGLSMSAIRKSRDRDGQGDHDEQQRVEAPGAEAEHDIGGDADHHQKPPCRDRNPVQPSGGGGVGGIEHVVHARGHKRRDRRRRRRGERSRGGPEIGLELRSLGADSRELALVATQGNTGCAGRDSA